MRCTPIRKERLRLRICADAKVFDLLDATLPQALRHIGRQIELPMIRPEGRREKARVLRIGGTKASLEFRSDLIGCLPDARADGGADALARGAKPEHGRNN